MATKKADAEELRAVASQKNLSLAVDHMMEFNAYNRRARELALSGAVERINDICLHMEFLYGSTPQEAATWRCAVPEQLGGPIGDVGSHCLYMAEFLLDTTITRIGCAYSPARLRLRVEEGAYIQFVTDRDIWGSARVSFNCARGGTEGTLLNLGFEVYGSSGVIRSCGTMFQLSGHSGEPIPLRLEVDRFASQETITIPSPGNLYQLAIEHHAESVRSGSPLRGEEGVHNLDLILACHRSAREAGRLLAARGRAKKHIKPATCTSSCSSLRRISPPTGGSCCESTRTSEGEGSMSARGMSGRTAALSSSSPPGQTSMTGTSTSRRTAGGRWSSRSSGRVRLLPFTGWRILEILPPGNWVNSDGTARHRLM
jgi:predicted dehydrogenase